MRASSWSLLIVTFAGSAFAETQPPLPPPSSAPPLPPPAAAPPTPPPYYPYPQPAYPPGSYPPYPAQPGQPAYYPSYPYPYAPPPPVIDDEGQAQPYGYHRETRPRRGPVIGGWIVFGIFYGITATVGLNNSHEGLLVIPVVGPLLRASSRDCSDGCEGARVGYTYSFLGQATGVGLLMLGYGAPNKVFVRDAGTFRVVPVVSPGHSGMSVVGAF